METVRHTLTKMQERLDTTVAEANAQGCEIDRLKVAIQGKSAPLKVAQTRLNMRTQRIRRWGTVGNIILSLSYAEAAMPGQRRRLTHPSQPWWER